MNKPIRICHISDTHGKDIKPLPDCDLLIHSGDAADNDVANFTPGYWEDKKFIPTSWQRGAWDFRLIDKRAEAVQQKAWWERQLKNLEAKGYGQEKLILTVGNHDFFDPTSLIKNSCWWEPKTITVQGIKIGLLPGINGTGLVGEWNDEITEYELNERILKLDRDIEILVAHTPAYGIIDSSYGGQHIGSRSLTDNIFGHSFKTSVPHFLKLKLVLHGHAHESRGTDTHEFEIEGYEKRVIKFSNAAQGRHLINFED